MIYRPHIVRSILPACCIWLLGFLPIQAFAANSAMLELIEILHNKGSITNDEYQLLKSAAMEDEEHTEVAQAELKQEVRDAAADSAGWPSKLSLKGDIRLRYSGKDDDPGIARSRGRLRYRLGVIGNISDDWEVGAGFASGTDDLRSTNQTFDDTFSTKRLGLDYAYAQYKLNDNFKFIGGKIKYSGYLYTVADMLWDSDVNPEGFSANFSHKSEIGTTFLNSGVWLIEENSSSGDDPHVYYTQLGQNFSRNNLFGTVAATYYTFQDITFLGAIATDGSNTDFNFSDIYSLSGQIGIRDLFGNGITTSLVADYVKNGDTDTDQDSGYLVGIKSSRGPWSASYYYVDLEQNAWPDILADSDRFDGLTGVKGHEIVLSYSLTDNIVLGVDYYIMENVFNEDQTLLQLDLNVRF